MPCVGWMARFFAGQGYGSSSQTGCRANLALAAPLHGASLTPTTVATSAVSAATMPTIATVTARGGVASVGLGLGLVPVHGPGREAAVTPGPGATAEIAELAPVRLRTLRREVDLSRQ